MTAHTRYDMTPQRTTDIAGMANVGAIKFSFCPAGVEWGNPPRRSYHQIEALVQKNAYQ